MPHSHSHSAPRAYKQSFFVGPPPAKKARFSGNVPDVPAAQQTPPALSDLEQLCESDEAERFGEADEEEEEELSPEEKVYVLCVYVVCASVTIYTHTYIV